MFIKNIKDIQTRGEIKVLDPATQRWMVIIGGGKSLAKWVKIPSTIRKSTAKQYKCVLMLDFL